MPEPGLMTITSEIDRIESLPSTGWMWNFAFSITYIIGHILVKPKINQTPDIIVM